MIMTENAGGPAPPPPAGACQPAEKDCHTGRAMPTEPRKKGIDALLLAMACGATVEAAARQSGLSERTAYRRIKEADFQERLQEVRAEMVQRAAGALTAASTEAVRTLLALQKESSPPAVRLGAARAVLEIGLKVRQLVEVEQQVAELEDVIAELNAKKGANRWA
jgi:hypothetical protein